MEELLCIGCGATIQTEDKGKLGYTPQSALEKAWRQANSIASAVSACAIIMKSAMSS